MIVVCCPTEKSTLRVAELINKNLIEQGQSTLASPWISEQADSAAEQVPNLAATIAVGWRPVPEFFNLHPNLTHFFNLGAGVDALLTEPKIIEQIRSRSINVVRLEDAGMGQQMVDYCKHQVFDWMYRFEAYRDFQTKSQWTEVKAMTRADLPIGVFGLGILGKAVAQAFVDEGFKVFGHARSVHQIAGVEYVADAAEFLSKSKVLIVLAPATSETFHWLNAERLAQLPQGARVINIARGALVDTNALVAALDSGQLSQACLDVFEQEPLPAEHVLWKHPKVRITPHNSAPTSLRPALQQILGKIAAMRAHQTISGIVDLTRGY